MKVAARLVAGVIGLSLSAALSARANLILGQSITVQETGVYGQVVNISSPGFYTGGPNFSITDAAPAGYSSWDQWLAAYEDPAGNAAPANLLALSSPAQQDYAVASVPDGGTTVGLLGMAFTALALLRRKLG